MSEERDWKQGEVGHEQLEVDKIYRCSNCHFEGTFKEVAENPDCIRRCKPDRNIALAEGLPSTVDPKVAEVEKTEYEREQEAKDMIVELHITIDKSKMPYVPKISVAPRYVEDWALLGVVFNHYVNNIVSLNVRPEAPRIVTPGQAAAQKVQRMRIMR